MTFSIDNPEGGLQQPPLRKICSGKTLRRTRVKMSILNQTWDKVSIIPSPQKGYNNVHGMLGANINAAILVKWFFPINPCSHEDNGC